MAAAVTRNQRKLQKEPQSSVEHHRFLRDFTARPIHAAIIGKLVTGANAPPIARMNLRSDGLLHRS
jgi:hypothetical protein